MDKINDLFETPKLKNISNEALRQYAFMLIVDFKLWLEKEEINKGIKQNDIVKILFSAIFNKKE